MSDFLVKRDDLRQCRIAESEPIALGAGQALLRIDRFGLTANNVTYAVMGEAMSYWDFFPTEDGWGRIPMWGFAEVQQSESESSSRDADLRIPAAFLTAPGDAGERRWGGVPRRLAAPGGPALGLPSLPGDRERSLLQRRYRGHPDAAAAALLYFVSDRRPARRRGIDRARPDRDLECLEQDGDRGCVPAGPTRRSRPDRPDLAAQHRVCRGPWASTAASSSTKRSASWAKAPQPMSTSRAPEPSARRSIHTSATTYSTAWLLGPPTGRSSVPAPATCPAQRRLSSSPPTASKRSEDWGRAELEQRVADAWHPFCEWTAGWLDVHHSRGFEGVSSAYLDVLEGRIDPRAAHVIRL